jgi:DeoR family fructose operon transcriptional repressor
MLDSCESLFLDDGTTTMAVAERLLTSDRPMTVVTPPIAIAAALAAMPSTDVLMLGGVVRSSSMATVGATATPMLADFNLDVAVLGASAISLERGVTTSDPATAAVKRAAINAARQRLFVGDRTKFGISSFCRFGDVGDFHTVITDRGLPYTIRARYRAAGIRLVRA